MNAFMDNFLNTFDPTYIFAAIVVIWPVIGFIGILINVLPPRNPKIVAMTEVERWHLLKSAGILFGILEVFFVLFAAGLVLVHSGILFEFIGKVFTGISNK